MDEDNAPVGMMGITSGLRWSPISLHQQRTVFCWLVVHGSDAFICLCFDEEMMRVRVCLLYVRPWVPLCTLHTLRLSTVSGQRAAMCKIQYLRGGKR